MYPFSRRHFYAGYVFGVVTLGVVTEVYLYLGGAL